MLRFTVLNNNVVLDPSVLLIQEFTDILEYSEKQKKDPKWGFSALLYVFFCCDLTNNNPLRDVDYRQKPEQASKRTWGRNVPIFSDKEQKLIDAAIEAYNYLNETALERATLTYDQKIDEIRSLLERTKPEINTLLDDNGLVSKYVSNASDLEKFAKLLNDMAVNKLKAMETAKKIENTGRVRGGAGSSLIERGAFLPKLKEIDNAKKA